MRKIAVTLITCLLAFGVSAVSAETKSPAIGGYCPVAYVAMGKAVMGDPKITADHEGKHYFFLNADARKMFVAEPAKYQVAYNGLCATAMSMGNILDSDPTMFVVADGTTYLFSSDDAKKMFESRVAESIKMADQHWAKVR